MKRCTGCRQELPLVCYWLDTSRPDGRHQYCKNCHSIRMARYWKEVYYPRERTRLIAAVMTRRRQREKVTRENENATH